MGSFSLSGGVEVYGFISPSDTTDQYPVIDPLYGIDGLRNVDLISDLNAIPLLRRRTGMVVGVSGTTYYKLNSPPWTLTLSDWSIFSPGSFTGGTVTGDTIFTSGLTANTFSAATYLGLPSDIYVSGYSYSNNTFTIERSAGNPNLSATINDVTGLTVNGDLIVTGTTFTDIISATTYQNLPLDVFVTGGTFSGGVITFVNNSGGTFGVSGISSFDTFVTGFTYNDNTLTILQNSGSPISVLIDTFTGLTINGDLNVTGTTYTDSISANTYQNLPIDPDTYITGFSYNNNTFTIGDNSGNTFDATFNDVTGLTINGNLNVTGNTTLNGLTATTISAGTYQNLPLDVFVTGGTYSAGTATFTNNSGGTFNVNGFLKYFISATTPTGATNGDRWFNTNDGRELVYVTDQDGSQWVVPNGTSSFFGSLSATTISATTYLNLPIDPNTYVTGFSYNNNEFVISDNSGNTFNALINNVTGLTVNGGLSATTIGFSSNCVSDIYVSNIHSCSPLYINKFNEGNVFIGSANTLTVDVINNRIGIKKSNPGYTLDVGGSIHTFGAGNSGIIIVEDTQPGGATIALDPQQGTGIPQLVTYGNFPIVFSTNNSERVRVTSTGNVGINNTSPSEKLDVVGKTKTTNIQITSGATNGYVLTSDVNGNGTWQQIPSFTGGTVSGATNFTNGLTATTISATTYQNLPINYGSFGLTIDGGGSDITIGNKGYVIIPYNATITGWSVVGNTSGSCVVDVWKTTSGNIPTSGDTITGTEKPTLSSQQINSDLNLTTWTTSVSQYDVIGFNVDSTSGLTRVNLSIYIIKQ